MARMFQTRQRVPKYIVEFKNQARQANLEAMRLAVDPALAPISTPEPKVESKPIMILESPDVKID